MSSFNWTDKADKVCADLAEGFTQKEVAARNNLSVRTVQRWLDDNEFKEEMERLSSMVALAHRGARIRLAQRVIRQRISEHHIETEKDLLDWLKFIQSETDGIKIGLDSAFAAAATSLAGSGQASDSGSSGGATEGAREETSRD